MQPTRKEVAATPRSTVCPVATGPWRFVTLNDSTRPEGMGMGTGCCAEPTPYSTLQQGARAGPPSTLPMQETMETNPTSLTWIRQVPQHPPYLSNVEGPLHCGWVSDPSQRSPLFAGGDPIVMPPRCLCARSPDGYGPTAPELVRADCPG